MNLSYRWLRELVPGLDDVPADLARRLTMLAAAVEGVTPVGEGLDGIVVARVLEVADHPNADRLRLCRVDRGGGDAIDVVCGAPVIVEGALYPYVPAGETLPGGFAIESRKIRGQMSHGMLCSEVELELGRDRGGIMRLGDGLEPGVPLTDALGLPDTRLTLDLNPNRVDLACHLGVARELAPRLDALEERDFGASWEPEWRDGEEVASGAGVTVGIEAPERCDRYLAAVVRGVRIGPSPAWLAGRLLAAGARPINNVVDATNYVLLERNQPLHAFDLGTLAGPEIRVRAARSGEPLTTLDGGEHELSERATVIADRDRAVALAGVMGGLETEVTSDTVDILLECASFDPRGVRDTAGAVRRATEASYRFERGIDRHAQEAALRRCVELVLAAAGGEADPEAVRVGPVPAPMPELRVRRGRIRQVLGLDLESEAIADLLSPIGFDARPHRDDGDGALAVRVPGWRGDVMREIDVVEEVARRYGYDRFPEGDGRLRPSAVPEDPAVARAGRARAELVGRGMHEARSLSFMPESHRGMRATVPVPNPLSAEESYLRAAMVPVLLRRVEHNFARGRRDVRLFELGTVFGLASDPPPPDEKNAFVGKFEEHLRLGAVWTGHRDPPHWSGPADDFDLWDLKGTVEDLAGRLCGADVAPFEAADDDEAPLGASWLEAEGFRVHGEGGTVGVAGRVRDDRVDAPPWAAPVFALELRLDAVAPRAPSTYRELSPYPAVRRDLSVLVPAGAAGSDLEAALREAASDLLESVELFDVYEGEELADGRRALGWAFRFRAPDRTLTDDEVEAEMAALSAALEERFDARIRSS